jgi:dethiobiotin synthetase
MVLYYEENKNHILIYNHLLSQKSLPLKGWIHNCYLCGTNTSKELDFDYNKNKYKIIVCKDCINNFNNLENEKLKKYINKKLILKFHGY